MTDLIVSRRAASVNTSLDAARRYIEREMAVIPVPLGAKRPQVDGWPQLRIVAETAPRYFAHPSNVGVLCGDASNNLIDVDLDHPVAVALAPLLLPQTDMIHGRPGKCASHWWYLVTEPVKTIKHQFALTDGDAQTMLGELRSSGCQTLVPPSIHPSGEAYTWDRDGDPALVSADTLMHHAAKLAAATVLVLYWPGPGSRDEAALAVCGMLARARWSVADISTFVCAVAREANDEEWRTRDKAAQTVEKLARGEAVSGARHLAEILRDGQRVVDWVRKTLRITTYEHELNERNELMSWTPPRPPERLAEAAYYGLAGRIVRAIEPHTESDPAALLTQFLAEAGSAAGRHAYVPVEADRHHGNLFVVIVGRTGRGRKGTSEGHCRRIVGQADPTWADHIASGLSSGEGLIHRLRDLTPDEQRSERAAGRDPADKRLVVIENEFVSLLKMGQRDGNTVSATARDAWDGRALQTLTKQAPERATNTHISIIGHITRDELLRQLTATEAANGFANRFLCIVASRARLLPNGGDLAALDQALAPLIEELGEALAFAQAHDGPVTRDAEADALWCQQYPRLTADRPGMVGAITARAEAQVVRLSLIYALLDHSVVITEAHLRAALAVWDYSEASARYIFGDAVGDDMADTLLRGLRDAPQGLTRTDLFALLGRNPSARRITDALRFLLDAGLVRFQRETTGGPGRPTERWFATRPVAPPDAERSVDIPQYSPAPRPDALEATSPGADAIEASERDWGAA